MYSTVDFMKKITRKSGKSANKFELSFPNIPSTIMNWFLNSPARNEDTYYHKM